MAIPSEVRRWLLEGSDPSVRARALVDLFDAAPDDPELRAARAAIGKEGWAARILADGREAGYWESFHDDGRNLYTPKYIATNWRLLVLSDLGVTRAEPRVDAGMGLLRQHWSGADGVFGEPGSETCITGNVARMMLRFGYADEPKLHRSLEWLVGAQKEDGGWHCFESSTGTLDAWEALAAFAWVPRSARSAAMDRAIARGADFYLDRGLLRETDGTTYAPWSRLHYPTHYYYDLLVGLDILTALGYGTDPRMREPLDRLERMRTADGRWRMDAVHPDLEPDDPYHPKTPLYPFVLEHVGLPSRWLTTTAWTVLRRAGRA